MLPRCPSRNLLCLEVIKIGYQPEKGVSSPSSQITALTLPPTLTNLNLLSFCLTSGNSFPIHTDYERTQRNSQEFSSIHWAPSPPSPPATFFGWHSHRVMQALLIYLLKRKSLRHLGRNFRSCTRKMETLLCLALYLEIPHKCEHRKERKHLENFSFAVCFLGAADPL